MAFQKAVRHKAKARICLSGPSGSGKTYSALLLAKGMGKKVAIIDTEQNSGSLYSHLYEYDTDTISPPFRPAKYIEKIREAEALGYDVIIIDSLSPAWASEGGALDQVDKNAAHSGNKFAAWRTVTPQHNQLVDAMLQSKCHIIATVRAKQEYAQVEENGKKMVKRIGLAPIQREGLEYEFTLFGEVDLGHSCLFTKDRTDLFKDAVPVRITPQVGETILQWLNAGTDVPNVETPSGEMANAAVSNTAPEKVVGSSPTSGTTEEACKFSTDDWSKLAVARKETGKILARDIPDDILTDFGRVQFNKESKKEWTRKEYDIVMAWLRSMWKKQEWIDYSNESAA